MTNTATEATQATATETRSIKQSLGHLAYQTMRKRILDNDWSPGLTLLEQDIAAELGMSRTPVREALIRLHEDGLVEVIPRHGMRVLPVSASGMREIYQVLSSLEATAASLAAQRWPSRNMLAGLYAAAEQMRVALKNNDLAAWAKADESFHLALVELSGNRVLIQTVARFWDIAHRARMMTLHLRPVPTRSTRDHTELCEAILAGDPTTAASIHRDHRDRGGREIIRILDILEHKENSPQ